MEEGVRKKDYQKPIKISEGIFWIGYVDEKDGIQCNPYLIVDNDEAVLIDGGSRTDFSTVMMKILQTGVDPKIIKHLIYQHYDPDLCGSIPHLESVISREDLKILSHRENNVFIKYYSVSSPMECIETHNFKYKFSSGRELSFIRTPYSHSPGSFITYDEKTKTLFTSDIFGSYGSVWDLYIDLSTDCIKCNDYKNCPQNKKDCPIDGIEKFHKKIMPSKKALNYALDKIVELDSDIIAPQHGSIIERKEDQNIIIEKLKNLKSIGIDAFLEEIKNEK